MLYVHEDVLGNTRYYTKWVGQQFCELRYDVWGAPTLSGKLLNNDNGNFARATFTGHVYDTTLDMYHAEARFYDAKYRQFMSADPIKDGLNWYAYVGANPVTFTDPTGLDIIIIVDESAAGTMGHISAIVERENFGSWFYYYWGNKNKILEPVPSKSLKSLRSFNAWLKGNGANKNKWKNDANEKTSQNDFGYSSAPYDMAYYIEGDFDASFSYYTELIYASALNYDDLIDWWNQDYFLLFNNCSQTTMQGFVKGTLPDGVTVTDYINNNYSNYDSKLTKGTIPNNVFHLLTELFDGKLITEIDDPLIQK